MRKLSLDLNALKVESFDPLPVSGERGTVVGRVDGDPAAGDTLGAYEAYADTNDPCDYALAKTYRIERTCDYACSNQVTCTCSHTPTCRGYRTCTYCVAEPLDPMA